MQTMNNVDAFDLLGPLVLTVLLVVLSYVWCRLVRRGKPLTSNQKEMISYAGLLLLGSAYAMVFNKQLASVFSWDKAWIAVIVVWGIALAVITWRFHAGRKTNIERQEPGEIHER